MGSLANLYQAIMLILLVMPQVMFSHCRIRMLVLQMLCAYHQFSNNFLQELHALSNSFWSLPVHHRSRRTTFLNKRQVDKDARK
ncbi:RNA-binding (RRM/RBD/RNP motifs) family protein [Zea mays]|uniref:RNA-binding (RRM/RBD/RNP motifs) family protein n=1 Tax=Zea mays TaxID=4577 RepID=A0A1D6P4M4_MAIZE|nr:RNA-binding (RRM/RBD/RNP motifs) family protein [Zea mays]